MNLEHAQVYDIETFPNCFTLYTEGLNSPNGGVFEISDFRDDRRELMQYFQWLNGAQIPMCGFNNLNFDYPVIHELFHNPQLTAQQLYQKAMSIINSFNRFGHMIWADNRFAPQIDLFKIYHMDNHAKSTSLKALQINMRSSSVVDMPVAVGTVLTEEQINTLLIPYNKHDVQETKKFAHHSKDAINFRISLIEQFGVDVLNWPDTKIGSKILETRLGSELCYEYISGKRQTRQTPRGHINIGNIIFPYVHFRQPEFQRIHQYLKQQILTSEEINQFSDTVPKLHIKGVFTNLKAHVGGLDFCFGTGGIHGSVTAQKVFATDEWLIRDIDVASLYPSIAIVNKLSPAHLGDRFAEVYSQLPVERKKWQKEKGKKCVEANTLKLASNGVYGNSNNQWSVFYDPQFTLTITINGQLMLCMLAEKLLTVPTLKIIQINTDGITYYIHKNYEPMAAGLCREWEKLTALTLEDTNYKRMWIRDVNSYIAESFDGSLKNKGAYWIPEPLNYAESIGNCQPPAWHKDLGNCVSLQAAIANMVEGVPIEQFIRNNTNPFDFICRAKVGRADQLWHGDKQIQRTSRYYISRTGQDLIKLAPPVTGAQLGGYKKANGITDLQYKTIMAETGGQWDERVCTKNKSKYENRQTSMTAGYKTSICNDIADFDFNNINYDWYISEASKLII